PNAQKYNSTPDGEGRSRTPSLGASGQLVFKCSLCPQLQDSSISPNRTSPNRERVKMSEKFSPFSMANAVANDFPGMKTCILWRSLASVWEMSLPSYKFFARLYTKKCVRN